MRQYIIYILFIGLGLVNLKAKSQLVCDTLTFINCVENRITLDTNNQSLDQFKNKISSIQSNNNQQVNIVHIGDSHLQAGFITEKIKQTLFENFGQDTTASPGFIFPYTIANTNNPFFYKVYYSGNWNVCKNIDQEKTCNLGLSGITVTTNDSIASFCIKMQNTKYNKPMKYYFNRIKILHNQKDSLQITINGITPETRNGFSVVELNHEIDSIHIQIEQANGNFELYGLILENSKSKLNYHTFGVNGATALSYLKCDYLSEQLQLINPDLIIISLGTNEAYDENFSTLEHEYILKDIIYQIQDILPNTAILFTTINDHLKKDQSINPNIIEVNKNIQNVCTEFELPYWDLYTIMGGPNSIKEWNKKGLTGDDLLHFKRLGYEIQGELFSNALIEFIFN